MGELYRGNCLGGETSEGIYPGENFIGGNCPGVKARGAIILGKFSWEAIIREEVVQGKIIQAIAWRVKVRGELS